MGLSPERRRIVFARNTISARLAGYRSHPYRCQVVTPRNYKDALRGATIDSWVRVIALNLDDDAVDAMLEHEQVALAWASYGKPTVEHVSTH